SCSYRHNLSTRCSAGTAVAGPEGLLEWLLLILPRRVRARSRSRDDDVEISLSARLLNFHRHCCGDSQQTALAILAGTKGAEYGHGKPWQGGGRGRMAITRVLWPARRFPTSASPHQPR